MSHYDVVPAPNSTADRWTHGPFSGYNDGTHIWGRGAADDKALLVAQCQPSLLWLILRMIAELRYRGINQSPPSQRFPTTTDIDPIPWI